TVAMPRRWPCTGTRSPSSPTRIGAGSCARPPCACGRLHDWTHLWVAVPVPRKDATWSLVANDKCGLSNLTWIGHRSEVKPYVSSGQWLAPKSSQTPVLLPPKVAELGIPGLSACRIERYDCLDRLGSISG